MLRLQQRTTSETTPGEPQRTYEENIQEVQQFQHHQISQPEYQTQEIVADSGMRLDENNQKLDEKEEVWKV